MPRWHGPHNARVLWTAALWLALLVVGIGAWLGR